MDKDTLKNAILQGQGSQDADLVLKGGTIFDLVSGQMLSGDIAICNGRIVGTCHEYSGKSEIDITGKVVVPGFIDTHLHVESSCLTPFEFDRCITPRGITTAICDPHEIANVAGSIGIDYFLQSSLHTILDLRINLSSCVPSSTMETSGARLEIKDLLPFKDHPSVIGLAEVMNYPGVLNCDKQILAKLEAFQEGHIDGHAPLVEGFNLNGYLSAGIRTDHETTSAKEALEKLSKGMHILIREGSVSKDLDALIPVITERNSPFLALCTDDRNPLDIDEHGHLDYMIRHAIKKGVEPLAIYRAASISAAKAFGLKDRGLVAPGWRADLVVLNSLEQCNAEMVFSAGRLVNEELFSTRKLIQPVARNSIKAKKVSPDQLTHKANTNNTHIIGIEPGKIITRHIEENIPVSAGLKQADITCDLIKIAVIERYGKNGNIANGFVRGFNLKQGAIASTVCHDHHNIVVIGIDEQDMALAANHLRKIEGGFVVVNNGEIIAQVALPIAGLMSLKSYEEVRDELIDLRQAAKSLGVTLQEPFLQLAFLALPVIPHLKITDYGLVNVNKFEIIS